MVNNASQMQINEHMYSKLNKCKLTGQFKNHKKGKHVGEDAKKSISAGWTKILKVRKKSEMQKLKLGWSLRSCLQNGKNTESELASFSDEIDFCGNQIHHASNSRRRNGARFITKSFFVNEHPFRLVVDSR